MADARGDAAGRTGRQLVGADGEQARRSEWHLILIRMDFLTFERTELGDGLSSLEAMASTGVKQHRAVMTEVQQVLDWAWRRFPGAHGPIDDGFDWDHDLQVLIEDGGWHTVTLTLTGTERFVGEFVAKFRDAED